MTVDLRKALRPAAEKLVEAFIDRLVAEVESTVARAQEQALASFEAALCRKEPAVVAPPDKRSAKRPARAKKAKTANAEAADRDMKPANVEAAPRQRAQMKCGICGELGFRREGCGKTHNVAPPPTKPAITNGVSRQSEILARAKARDAGAARS